MSKDLTFEIPEAKIEEFETLLEAINNELKKMAREHRLAEARTAKHSAEFRRKMDVLRKGLERVERTF